MKIFQASRILKLITATGIILTLIGISSCSKKMADKAIVIFNISISDLLHPDKSVKTLRLKDIIKKGDSVKTGKNSHLVFQVGLDLVVNMQPVTEISAEEILEAQEVGFSIESGKITVNINKLMEKSSFKITSPNCVNSVRGTLFSVSYYKGKTIVSVKEGTVEIQHNKTNKVIKTTARKTVIITGSMTTRPINKIELLEIEMNEAAPAIKDLDSRSAKDLDEMNKEYTGKIRAIEKKIEALGGESGFALRTLDDIKQKYGRVDQVSLSTGKVYRGVILSRGAVLRVLTSVVLLPYRQRRLRGQG